MKYVNKGSLLIVLFLLFLFYQIVPKIYQENYLFLSMIVVTSTLTILIGKYKCVNLLAGVDCNDQTDVDTLAKYGGRLMFLITIALVICAMINFINTELTNSWFMILPILPAILYFPYVLYKCNMPK